MQNTPNWACDAATSPFSVNSLHHRFCGNSNRRPLQQITWPSWLLPSEVPPSVMESGIWHIQSTDEGPTSTLQEVIPVTQWSANDRQTSPSRRADWSTDWTITGLNTFSSNWPLLPETVTVTWLPITWAATIVIASHCVGFTLPVAFSNRLILPISIFTTVCPLTWVSWFPSVPDISSPISSI